MSVAAIGLFLSMFALLAQFAVWYYARGSVRTAAIEAARAAAPFEASDGACERRFDSVRRGLLGGSLGDGVGSPRCVIGPDTVTVTVAVHFEGWLPVSPDWSFEVTAVSVRERLAP